MRIELIQKGMLALAMLVVPMVPGTQAVAADPASATEDTPQENQAAKPDFPAGFIEEGPLPEGFPPPGEVGKIVEKTYPDSRTYSAEGDNAFMRCFAYLAKNRHEMTVPVILDYHARGAGDGPATDATLRAMAVDRMHFILEKPSLDEPKQDGPVTVADMPPLRVLSIAYQGPMTAEALSEAESKLTAELERRGDLVAAGAQRVLGYNSPMVPRDKAYWEVQLPVRSAGSQE